MEVGSAMAVVGGGGGGGASRNREGGVREAARGEGGGGGVLRRDRNAARRGGPRQRRLGDEAAVEDCRRRGEAPLGSPKPERWGAMMTASPRSSSRGDQLREPSHGGPVSPTAPHFLEIRMAR